MMQKVKFQDNIYGLVGELSGEMFQFLGAAIAPLQDFNDRGVPSLHGSSSFAHLMPNGDIMRYGKVIGKRADLELLHDVG